MSPDATKAINDPRNNSLKFPPMYHQEKAPSRQSREPTPERAVSQPEVLEEFYQEGLQLTFNNTLAGNKGFCLGTNANKCDIILPDQQRQHPVSGWHCYLTFNNQNHLILRDKSRHGTTVLYDGKGGEKRRNFTWILGGHSVLNEIKEVIIHIHQQLQFRIFVFKPQHPEDLSRYIDNVEQFRSKVATSGEPSIGELGLQSKNTTAPVSGAHSPREGPIFLERKIVGSGSFGVVTHRWDVSTGVEYACKMPHDTLDREQRLLWEKEIRIMGRVKHENIVKFYPQMGGTEPCLYLDYLPRGNLRMEHLENPFSYNETLMILSQCLSALKYLHEKNPPVAHRDLKPANILVRERNPLHVQLADFGLAKEGTSLRSRVGTECYVPPEYFIASKPGEKYSVKIDIWSLGVVALDLTHGLPTNTLNGIPWCKTIIDRVNKYQSEGPMQFLATHMLVLKPEDRSAADICLKAVEQLRVPSRDGSRTPTQASFAEENFSRERPSSPDNAISGFSSDRINAYISTNIHIPESRKRSTQSRSSSGTYPTKPSKRLAQKANHNNHAEQNDSEFILFHREWLQDSKCVGSEVAEMGREDPPGWNSTSDGNSTIKNISENRSTRPNVGEQFNDPERPCSDREKELARLLQRDKN
ncbi:CAMK family protein kinase [Histoplasma capsulatum G186AR]|uniref:non-specific serine/threonine protein kinase n=2 Tax=Ajellomyces capsulatus TaxID=5037 RepID=C0NYA8_AJECG|nr:CAMK family protein kinase [Histoplasma capsulatum G186AR]EEH03776.1 CAMK family protein kinase [Histoplasma capsulatum G186AR]